MNGIGRFETSRGVSWKIRFRVPIEPGSRRTRQITETLRYCPSRKAAEGVLATREAQVFNGTYRRRLREAVTVTEMIKRTLDARASELKAISAIRGSLENHVARLLGGKYLSEVTTGDCEDYHRERQKEGAAPKTAKNELRYLQMVFAEARKRGLADIDPVSPMRFRRVDKVRERIPTQDELVRLANAALRCESFMRPMFFVLLGTGLRIGSVLKMRWDDVHFDEGWFETYNKGGGRVRPPLSEALAEELEAWRSWSESLQDGEGWVFPAARVGKDGKRGHLSAGAVQDEWAKLLKAAEVTGLVRHDMRRSMVTRLRDLGADDKTIGAITGHQTEKMIDRYDRKLPQRMAERFARLSKHLESLMPISADANQPNSDTSPDTKTPEIVPNSVARKP